MTLSPRQKLGTALVLISLLGAAIVQYTTGDLVHITGHEEPPVSGPLFSTQSISLMVTISWRYAVPIAACGLLGLYCLVIPRRPAKPRP